MTLLEAKQLSVDFPAHPHTTLGAIAETDVTYLDFLAGQTWFDFHLKEAVAVLCEHYGRTPKFAQTREDPRQRSLFNPVSPMKTKLLSLLFASAALLAAAAAPTTSKISSPVPVQCCCCTPAPSPAPIVGDVGKALDYLQRAMLNNQLEVQRDQIQAQLEPDPAKAKIYAELAIKYQGRADACRDAIEAIETLTRTTAQKTQALDTTAAAN
jgi:hypothetical protein